MKKAFLLKKINLEIIEDIGQNMLVILPRRWTIRRLRERLVERNGLLFDTDIFTFDDLLTSAKDEILKNRRLIAKDQEVLVVFNLLKEIFKEDKDYENVLSAEFIGQVLYLINYMFLESKEYPNDDVISSGKYGWLKKLYMKYRQYLDENALVNKPYLEDLSIKLYEDGKMKLKSYKSARIAFFIDFRVDQKRLLEVISKQVPNIEVYIPFFSDIDLCKDNAKFLDDLGFEILYDDKNLSDYDSTLYNSCKKAFSYPNIMLEIKNLVKMIKKDYIQNKTDFKKIAVVTPSVDRYKDILIRTFSEELLPVNLNHQKSLIEFGFVRFAIDLLEFLGGEFDKNNFLEIVTNRLLNREGAEFDVLIQKMKEIYISEFEKIHEIIEEIEFFCNLYNLEEEAKNIQKIERIYRRLERLKNSFDFSPKPFYAWLEITKDVFGRLGITKTAEFVNDIEFLKAFYSLNEILEKDAKKLSEFDVEFSFEEFLDTFRAILSQKMVDVSLNILNGIDVLSHQDTIGSDYKKIYFIGLSDDIFPMVRSEGFLMNHEIKDELDLFEIKDFDYQFQKDLVCFRTILKSHDAYLSYPRFNRVEMNKSPFFELEDISCVQMEEDYAKPDDILTYQDHKFMRNIKKASNTEKLIYPNIPLIDTIKDRELIFLQTCPLKFLFKKFGVDKIEDDESYFSTNLKLIFALLQKMFDTKDEFDIEKLKKILLDNIRYTNIEAVKLLSAANIVEMVLEIFKKMLEYGVDEFVAHNIANNILEVKQEFEGFTIALYPNFIVKIDGNEIFGFVKNKFTKNNDEIDKLWIAHYIFGFEKIAAIYLQEPTGFVIHNFDGIKDDNFAIQSMNIIKDQLSSLYDIKKYKRSNATKRCYNCGYSHVCVLF